MSGVRLSEEDREKLNELAAELLGAEWEDDDPFDQVVELIRRYGDPHAILEEVQDFNETEKEP